MLTCMPMVTGLPQSTDLVLAIISCYLKREEPMNIQLGSFYPKQAKGTCTEFKSQLPEYQEKKVVLGASLINWVILMPTFAQVIIMDCLVQFFIGNIEMAIDFAVMIPYMFRLYKVRSILDFIKMSQVHHSTMPKNGRSKS